MSRVAITDGLITLANAKTSLGLGSDTTYDADLEHYIMAATPIVEGITGPQIARTRTFTFNGGDCAVNIPVRFNTVTSVTVDGTATTSYVADPTAGIVTSLGRFATGTQNVVVVVTVGATTPGVYAENVILATRELVRFWWQQGRQANRPGVAEADTSAILPGSDIYKRVWQLLKPSQGLPGFA